MFSQFDDRAGRAARPKHRTSSLSPRALPAGTARLLAVCKAGSASRSHRPPPSRLGFARVAPLAPVAPGRAAKQQIGRPAPPCPAPPCLCPDLGPRFPRDEGLSGVRIRYRPDCRAATVRPATPSASPKIKPRPHGDSARVAMTSDVATTARVCRAYPGACTPLTTADVPPRTTMAGCAEHSPPLALTLQPLLLQPDDPERH